MGLASDVPNTDVLLPLSQVLVRTLAPRRQPLLLLKGSHLQRDQTQAPCFLLEWRLKLPLPLLYHVSLPSLKGRLNWHRRCFLSCQRCR